MSRTAASSLDVCQLQLAIFSVLSIDTVDSVSYFFFFQAEDGIRDYKVTGVQTCALPIFLPPEEFFLFVGERLLHLADLVLFHLEIFLQPLEVLLPEQDSPLPLEDIVLLLDRKSVV